jgi:hypothetical protein
MMKRPLAILIVIIICLLAFSWQRLNDPSRVPTTTYNVHDSTPIPYNEASVTASTRIDAFTASQTPYSIGTPTPEYLGLGLLTPTFQPTPNISSTISAVLTHYVPLIRDKPQTLPLSRSDIMPGVTIKEDVRAVLGEPLEIAPRGDSWFYRGELKNTVTIVFEDELVTDLFVSSSSLLLSELISQAGEPSIVEWRLGRIGEPPVTQTKIYHYPLWGVSYYSLCPSGHIELCKDILPSDTIEQLHQYIPITIEELIKTRTYVVPLTTWSGFDE